VDVTSKPKKAILNQLAQFATDEGTKKKLPSDEYMTELNLEKKGIIDVIKDNKLKIPLAHFIDIAPALQPRYYSISSSSLVRNSLSSSLFSLLLSLSLSLSLSLALSLSLSLCVCTHTYLQQLHPNKIQLTVSLARAEAASGKMHLGVCSHFLHDRIKEQTLRVFVKTSLFRLPPKVASPVIMVAVGCGIAPFIGFLQHRRFQAERGSLLLPFVFLSLFNISIIFWVYKKENIPLSQVKNILYFGANHSKKDFLYEKEFREYQQEGFLDLKTAFYEEDKVFVQHRMMENMQEIWNLIDKEGANFYICG